MLKPNQLIFKLNSYTMKFIHISIVTIILLSLVSCNKDNSKKNILDEQFYISRAGADMPVWVNGNQESKTFVVTVHGGPILGYGLDFRRGKHIKELEDNYAFVYWDQRHSGAAHGSYTNEELSVTDYVEDLNLLIRTLEKRYGEDISIFIMGHSWGGFLSATHLTTKDYQDKIKGWINISGDIDFNGYYIDVVNRIVFFAETAILEGEDVDDWKFILDEVQKIDTTVIPLTKVDEKLFHEIEKTANSLLEKHQNQPQYVQNQFNSNLIGPAPSIPTLLGNVLQAYKPLSEELEAYKLKNDLPKITVPCLFIFGKYDLGNSPDVGQEFYDNVGSVSKELIIYQKSNHEAMSTEPEVFNSDFINFVETHK